MGRSFQRWFASAARLAMNNSILPEIFLPPVNRSMRVLDRTFFKKVVKTSAVAVPNSKNISLVKAALSRSGELLNVARLHPVREDMDRPGGKVLVLMPAVKVEDRSTWSNDLQALVTAGTADVKPYQLLLTYDDWNMSHILDAILPEMPLDESETPAGFALTGHVAHLNLRAQYLPFKYLIGQVLADKNGTVTTVINKIEDVGSESEFRTFPFEVLTGPHDLNVIVNEGECTFQFDFSQVYWNSRLGTEHARIVNKFRPGEAVCDVMAGVGPFAIPAGKKFVFVRANDLNPACYSSLELNIKTNNVGKFVLASHNDGRDFIRIETEALRTTQRFWKKPPPRLSRHVTDVEKQKSLEEWKKAGGTLHEPPVFGHYVMNLPATAVEFLDAFRGLFKGREHEFSTGNPLHGGYRLPFIHVYTFQSKWETIEEEQRAVCRLVSDHLGAEISPDDDEVDIHRVRVVAPKKVMYCATFRLPPAIAFAS